MKYLKTFNENSNNQYGVGDWVEDLKNFEWGTKSLDYNTIKKWSDHFVGSGWCDKIWQRIGKIFDAFNRVDIDDVEMRMYDVWDQIPSEKDKWVSFCVTYGNPENYNKSSKYKYSGLVFIRKRDENDKLRILIHILKEIVFPTLYIGYPSYYLRQSEESYYVTDKKWQCQNFNIDDYKEMGIEVGAQLSVEYYRDKKVHITEYDIKKKKDYSIDKIIEMYVPCITIEIGKGQGDNYMKGPMNLTKLESILDESLEEILPAIDYQEVIFDMSRGDRGFDPNTEIYGYTVKILLNF